MAAYAAQTESPLIRRLLGGDVAVSRLAEVEVVSALARLTRDRAVSASIRDAAIAAFLKDLAAWEIVEVTREVTARAREALLVYRLRASDTVQLASALVLESRLGEPLETFVALDARLLEAARAERLRVAEP